MLVHGAVVLRHAVLLLREVVVALGHDGVVGPVGPQVRLQPPLHDRSRRCRIAAVGVEVLGHLREDVHRPHLDDVHCVGGGPSGGRGGGQPMSQLRKCPLTAGHDLKLLPEGVEHLVLLRERRRVRDADRAAVRVCRVGGGEDQQHPPVPLPQELEPQAAACSGRLPLGPGLKRLGGGVASSSCSSCAVSPDCAARYNGGTPSGGGGGGAKK